MTDNHAAVKIQKLHRSRIGRTRTSKGLSASGRLPVGQRQLRAKRRKTLAIAPATELELRSCLADLFRQAAGGAEPGACVDPLHLQLNRLNPRPGEAAWLCDVASEEAGNVLMASAEASGARDGTATVDLVLRTLNAMVATVEGALLQPPTMCISLFWGERGVSEKSCLAAKSNPCQFGYCLTVRDLALNRRVAFCRQLASATTSLDVAIFSISDDRIEKELQDAHRRGVVVRVISDDVGPALLVHNLHLSHSRAHVCGMRGRTRRSTPAQSSFHSQKQASPPRLIARSR